MANSNYRGLSEKQAAFAAEFNRNGGNASAAYRHAYECENMTIDSVNRAAYRLTRAPKISKHLLDHNKVRERAVQQAAETGTINAAWIVQRLVAIANPDIRRLFYPDGRMKLIQDLDDDLAASISSIEVREHIGENGTLIVTHKIKRFNPQPALDSLAKYLKMFSDEPSAGKEALTPEAAERRNQVRARVAAMLERMANGEIEVIPPAKLSGNGQS